MRTFLKKHTPLILLLFAVAVLAARGIFFEYGRLASVPDESHVVYSVLKFFRDWNFADPYAYAFPVMTILYIPSAALMFVGGIVLGIFGGYEGLVRAVVVDTNLFVPGFRVTTVFVSLATLALFYAFCERIFSSRASAWVATYMLATSFIFTKTAFVAVKWIPQLFLVAVALYFFVRLLDVPRLRLWHYALAGVLIALSYGVALVGLIAIVPFAFVLYHLYREGRAGDVKKGLIVFFILLITLMGALTLASPELAKNSFLYAGRVVESGVGEPTVTEAAGFRFWGYAWVMARAEPLLLLFAIAGAFLAWKRYRLITLALLSYIALYYFMLGPVMGAIRDRRMLLILIPLAFFSAVFVRSIWGGGTSRARKALVVVSLAPLLINPLVVGRELSKESTYLEARAWVEKNIPSGALVYDECNLELEEDIEKVSFAHQVGPAYETTRGKYVLEHPEVIEGRPAYFVLTDISLLSAITETPARSRPVYFVSCSRATFGSLERKEELETQLEVFGITARYPGASLKSLYDSAQEGYLTRDNFLFAKTNDPWYVLSRWNEPNTGEHIRIFEILD